MAMPCMCPDLNGPEWMVLGSEVCAVAVCKPQIRVARQRIIEKNRFMITFCVWLYSIAKIEIFFITKKLFIYLLYDSLRAS